MSFFASLGLKWDEFKSGMDGARAEVDKFAAKVNNKGMFSDFQSRANKLRDVAGGIGASLASGNALGAIAGTEAALMKMGPAMGAVAVGSALVSVAAMGMWSAMSKSKELNNTATQAGITVVQLLTLEKAFTKAGVSADQVPSTMAKFASALGELSDPGSKAAKVLASIGLNADSFKGKSQYEAYKLVATGIDGMTSATDKLIAKRVLFGRGGPLISDAQIASAEKALPKSAQLMQDFAPTFTEFQAQIGKLAVSFQPLFTGMASVVIPTLSAVVDEIERIDLTEQGVMFGEAIAESVIALESMIPKLKDVGTFLRETLAMFTFGQSEVAIKAIQNRNQGAESDIYGPAMPTLREKVQMVRDKAKAEHPARTDTGIDLASMAKRERFTMPVVESLTKVGGGALANDGNQLLDVQRESLRTQQRMAAALDKFVTQFKPESDPYIGINDATAKAA